MKKLVLFTTLALSFTALAEERSFRVNPTGISRSGFGTAWGIKDRKLDFEKLDQSPEEEIWKVLNGEKGKVVNYLVDIERNQVLAELGGSEEGDFAYGRLGSFNLEQYFSLEIQDIYYAEGLKGDDRLLLLISHSKWGNSINDAIIISRTDEKSEFKKKINLEGGLEQAVLARLTPPQKAQFTDLASHYEIKEDNMGKYHLEINADMPKCPENCIGITIKSELAIKVEGEKVKFTLTNLKYKATRYPDK